MNSFKRHVLLFIAALAAPSQVPAQNYEMIDLGYTIDSYSAQLGLFGSADINNNGQVIYHRESYRTPGTSYFWENGQSTFIASGQASDINDSGQVTGYAVFSTFPYQDYAGYIWQNGVFDYPTYQGSTSTDAAGINNLGQVVINFGHVSAFLLDSGTFTNLGNIPLGTYTYSRAINNVGQIVGIGGDGFTGSYHGFIWENNSITDLNTRLTPDFEWSIHSALKINDLGQILGRSKSLINGNEDLYLLDGNNFIDLGGFALADINNQSQVVFGTSLWEAGNVTSLSSLLPANSGWSLVQATGINDQGQIVGVGIMGGEYRGFLLSPIPEPGTWALLGIGLLAVGWIRFSRGVKRSSRL